MTSYWCGSAWLGDGPVASVRVVEEAGRIAAVVPGVAAEPDDCAAGVTALARVLRELA